MTRRRRPRRRCLLDLDEVDDEDERLVRGDRRRPALAPVGEVGRDRQHPPAPHAHPGHALVPTRDDHALAEVELEGLARVPRGVELLARAVGDADVLDRHVVALPRALALALDDVLLDQVRGRLAFRLGDRRLRREVLVVRRGRGRLGLRGGRGRRGGGLLVLAAAAREEGEGDREEEWCEERAMRHSPRQGSGSGRTIRRVTAASLPPGPTAIPLNLLGWTARPIPFMERSRRRYGDRFTVDMGPPEGKWIFVTQPEKIREVFTAPADVLHPGEGARVLEPIVGPRSVLLLDEREHLAQRKLMLPAFHGERMRALVGVMEEVAAAEVASWRRGASFALHERTQALTLEVILRAVFGLAAGPRLDELRVTLKQLLDLGASPLTLLPPFRRRLGPLTTWSRFLAVRERADALILALVDERRRAGEQTDDVLSMLLAARDEDGRPMSDGELRDELVTLLVAGHETTASELSWAFEQLVRAPEVLERVTRAAAEDDEPYLEATVKEILRRRPVLPIAQPRRIKQPVEIGGREYPAGPAFTACIYLVHHDERIYPEPYAFRPERFLDGSPGTYSWIPFGGGVRRCLGASFAQLEMRIALRAILAEVEVTSALPGREGSGRRSITLSPRRGTPISVRARAREPQVALSA